MLNQQKDNYVISGICSKLAVKDTYHIVRQYNIPIPWFEHKSRNCFPFIWTANQRTVFYVIGTSVRKELNILGKYQLKATTKILKQAPWWMLLCFYLRLWTDICLQRIYLVLVALLFDWLWTNFFIAIDVSLNRCFAFLVNQLSQLYLWMKQR